MVYYYKEGII